ncbi:MAG: PAS domain-containing protein [Syntrophaceae bacterium]
MWEEQARYKLVESSDSETTRKDILEIKNRLYEIFLVHVETGNSIQHCTSRQLWDIKNGLGEIRRILIQYAPETKRARPLKLLEEYLDVLNLATMPFVFGSEKLFYPRTLYSELFEAANEAECHDSPAWLIEHMVGSHIIYNDAGYILHATGTMGGYDSEEIIGKHFAHFIVPEHLPGATEQYGNLLKGKRGSHSYLMRQKDGSEDWYTSHCHPYTKDGKLMVLSAIKPGQSEDYLQD